MKTIEDKAKAYDEALERAKEKYLTCYSPTLLDYIFPELKENKDIKIKKDIISNLKRYINCIKDGYNTPSAKNFIVNEIEKQIIWLKKQYNESATIDIDIESMVSSFKQRLKSQARIKMENNPLVNICLTAFRRGVENTLEELNLNKIEKQGGQEFIDSDTLIQQWVDTLADIDAKQSSADNVKPKVREEKVDNQNCVKSVYNDESKFKAGDWIVFTNGNVERIISVGTHGYTFDDGDYLLHDKCDKDAHLWTIQDAMDGDVLVNGSNIFIFHFINGTRLVGYCHVNTDNGRFYDDIGKNECFGLIDAVINPATKEQRDTLFAKMKKAGYTFDFEKKELKKVKQEQDSINLSEYINDIGGNGCYLKNTAQVSSWSKKDEKMFEYALNMIEWYSGKNEDKSRFVSNWLKSIKDRVGCEVNCTTTKEWSEDDERIKKRLINLVNEVYDNTNYITFLEQKELLAWLEKLDDNAEL